MKPLKRKLRADWFKLVDDLFAADEKPKKTTEARKPVKFAPRPRKR